MRSTDNALKLQRRRGRIAVALFFSLVSFGSAAQAEFNGNFPPALVSNDADLATSAAVGAGVLRFASQFYGILADWESNPSASRGGQLNELIHGFKTQVDGYISSYGAIKMNPRKVDLDRANKETPGLIDTMQQFGYDPSQLMDTQAVQAIFVSELRRLRASLDNIAFDGKSDLNTARNLSSAIGRMIWAGYYVSSLFHEIQ